MDICFYNLNHIGDIYFTSIFLNIICKQNPQKNFLYFFINGDIFLKHITNIKRIFPIEENYSNILINGNPPEDLLNKNLLTLLLNNNMTKSGFNLLNIDNKDILFVNTWCASNILSHDDYNITESIKSYSNLINVLNKRFNLDLKYLNYDVKIQDHITFNNEYKMINTNDEDLENTIFVFNFNQRSLQCNKNILNSFIIKSSIEQNVIVSCYDSTFDNVKNIKFIDKDYGIHYTPSCENLLQIWDIAIKCKKVIMITSGSSWTFLHKLNNLKQDQLLILNDTTYCNKLNNLVNLLLNENKNIINCLQI